MTLKHYPKSLDPEIEFALQELRGESLACESKKPMTGSELALGEPYSISSKVYWEMKGGFLKLWALSKENPLTTASVGLISLMGSAMIDPVFGLLILALSSFYAVTSRD